VEPPKTGRTREFFATLPSRFLENEEAPVARWPNTARERVFLLFVLVTAFAVWMSGSITWAVVAVGAVATVVFFDWYRMGHMQVLTLPETHRDDRRSR
jgi:hypothetical protein